MGRVQTIARTYLNRSIAAQVNRPRTGELTIAPTSPLRWLQAVFPRAYGEGRAPLSEHHLDLLRWFWELRSGQAARPFVAVWPRGGRKSTTVEEGTVMATARGARRYVLYVSETQDQADDHVGSIEGLLGTPEFSALYPRAASRKLSKYGHSKGWTRQRLRTESGVVFDAFGLDKAGRGAKVEDARPDLIVLDDVDGENDSAEVTQKKIRTITRKILPMGATDVAVVFAQNLVHPRSIAARLTADPFLGDGVTPNPMAARFLGNRLVSGPIPAVRGLTYEQVFDDVVGLFRDLVTGGVPVWEGQDLAVVQAFVDLFGIDAFLSESQHQVKIRDGGMFERSWFKLTARPPHGLRLVRSWDFAATERKEKKGTGGSSDEPDYTAGVLIGEYAGAYYILDVRRTQANPAEVEELIRATALEDAAAYGVDTVVIEQEPGSSGKTVVYHYAEHVLPEFDVVPSRPRGSKAVRAKPLSGRAKGGNVYLVTGDRQPGDPLPEWVEPFLSEIEVFPLPGEKRDQVDATTQGFKYLAPEAAPEEEGGDEYGAARG